VLLNLIVNAMDAMDDTATSTRRVRVKTLRGSGRVEVAVTDTGHGIPEDALPKLFDAFFTTKPEGIGLGLAIARKIVEAHTGRLWAEQPLGGGATFHVELPARA
jgi:signal transduction histidine kinase